MTDEARPAFVVPDLPSEAVQRFLKENPTAKWTDCLTYVLDNHPQVQDGKVQYLIEGGAALNLLFPEREADDVDILTRSTDMQKDFKGASNKIDVKYVADWYARHFYPYNPDAFKGETGDDFFGMSQEVKFGDRQVLILNRLGLAVAKTVGYFGKGPREKDTRDLALLNQNPADVQRVIQQVRTKYPTPAR